MAKKYKYRDWRDTYASEVDAHNRQSALEDEFAQIVPSLMDGGMNAAQINALHSQWIKTGGADPRPEDIANFDALEEEAPDAAILPSRGSEPLDNLFANRFQSKSAPTSNQPTLPDFSDVQSKVATTEEDSIGSTLSTLGATLRDSLKSMGARALDQFGRLPNVSSTYDVMRQLTGVDPEQVSKGIAASLRQEANDPLRIARTEQLRNRFEQEGGVKGFIGAGGVDALSSPSSVLSLVGGPLGAVAVADAYALAYEQGQQNNLKGQELEAWALSQAAPELVSFIPAGKAISKIPVIGPMIEKRLAKAAAGALERKITNPIITAGINTAKAAVGEGAEEMFTGSLQDLAAAAFAGQNQAENLQRMGQLSMPQDEEGNFSLEQFGQNRYRDFRAAVVTAGATGPVHLYQANRDANRDIEAQRQRGIAAALAGEQAERETIGARPTPQSTVEPSQPDMFGTEEGLPSVEEYQAQRQKENEQDAAYRLRDRERAEEQKVKTRDKRRNELRDSINRRIDTERDQVETLRDRVEGGDTSSATLSTLAAAQRRLNVAENDLANFENNFPTQEVSIEQPTAPATPTQEAEPVQADLLEGQRAVELSAASDRLKAARAKQAEKSNEEASKAKAAETARQNRLAEQVAEEHADKPEAEQAQILADLIANKETKPKSAQPKEQTQEEKIQGVINQVEGLRKRQNTQRVNNRIRSLYKADPTRTAQDIAAILNEQEGGVAVSEDNAPTESDLADKVATLNKRRGDLSMADAPDAASIREQEATQPADGTVVPRTAEQETAYRQQVSDFVKALPNTKEGVAILNLIKQGKLILTDKGQSVGRANTSDKGTYSPSKGKQYIELNNIDPKAPKAAILSQIVSHESAHAGQFNQRDGRSALFKHLLGDKGNAAANQQIRDLAKSGNKLAQAAEAAAKKAAEANDSFTNVEDLELVPYLFSEAKSQKFAPGRVGKIVRDVKVAARQVNRKLLNTDLDFSIDEIADAADRVAEEIVNTDTAPDTTQEGDVSMVLGNKAKEASNIAKKYKGAVDGLERWLISDRGADTLEEAKFPLSMGETVNLKDVLDHPRLYENYPELADYTVVQDRSLKGLGAGLHRGDRKEIALSPESVANLESGEVRNTMLHEVQHAVQTIEGFVSGANWKSFESPILRGDLERANERLDKVVDRFHLGVWKNTSPAEAVRQMEQALPTDATPREQSEYVLSRGLEKLSSDRIVQGYGDNVYSKVRNAQNLALQAFNRDQFSAMQTYLKDYGEAEARTTEYASNMPQEELDRTNFEDLFQEARDGVPVKETINTRELFRARQNNREPSLSMAQPTESEAANPKFSVKERINRILSHGRQERLDTVKIAEDLHSQFVDAVKSDTGAAAITNSMNKDFTDFLTNPEHSTPEGRERIVDELKKKYPNTTSVLLEARDRISDMTMDTINDMLSTGRPLSITQRKNIATMLANKDTYMSRAYAAFQTGRGRKWAETRWSNFTKNIGKDADSITNPKVKADVLAVRDAINVITNGLRIPDVNTLQDMPMDSLVSLADRHGIKESQLQYDRDDPDASWLKRDELISELEKVKVAYPEGKLESFAMEDAKSIMGLGDRASAFAKQMSDLAKNPGTLKERQRVPLEVRRMLGEIELAPGAFMATMANQAALRARAKVVSELVNDPQGDLAITREQYSNLSEKEKGKYKEVRSEEWGALNGMYLRDHAYNRMEEVTGLLYSWRDAAKRMSHDVTPILGKTIKGTTATLGALNRWNKLMTVVYNPFSWVGNFGGSFLNMVGAGNFSPTALSEGMGTAREYVGGTFKTNTTPRLSKVIRYMNLEAADIAELQNVLGNTLEKYFDGTASSQDVVKKLDKHGHNLAGRIHRSVIAGYAIADNWSKIANFYHRYGVLKDMYDAAGIKKTEDQILQEAGDDTSYTNISPERVHSLIRTAESAGISQYAPYFAEVLRTRATNVALAHKDFQRANQFREEGNNKAANIMYKSAALRLAGQAVVNVGMPVVGAFKVAARLMAVGVPSATAYAVANGLAALGGDDEDNEKKRRMLSEFNRIQDLMLVGKNKDGYPIYLPYSQKLDPNGPFTDLIRAFTYADDYKDVYQNLKESSLYIFPQILKDSWNALTNDKFPESDIGRVWPELKQTLMSAGISANEADRYLNIADNVLPGVFRAMKTQNTVDGVDADPETKRTLELMNKAGVRFETLDPRRVLKGYADNSNEAKATNNGVLNRSLINAPTVTKKVVLDATEQFFRNELERQKEDYKNVQSLRAWKFNDEQIAALLEQGGYGKKAIPDMVEGNATVTLSLKSLLGYAETSGSYQDTRDYERRKQKAVEVANMILEMEPELNELGITVDKSQIPKEWRE